MFTSRRYKKRQITRAAARKVLFFRQSISFAAVAFLFLQQLLILSPVTARAAVSTSIVISQFQVAGVNAADEFVELHNIGGTSVDINGYRLVYRSATGTSDVAVTNWTSAAVIPAGGYYLITNTTGYDDTAASNITFTSGSTGSFAAAGGGFALRSGAANTGAIIDSVGYGSAANAFVETAVTSAPAANAAKSRNAGGCADTDNNSSDFATVNPSAPRNGSTPVNICGSGSVSTNLAGIGSANPNSLLAGSATLLTVKVTPGTNPASGGIKVTGDLSSIGGTSNQIFVDNGNNSFSFQSTIAGNTSSGSKNLPVTITDAQGRTGKTSISLNVEQASTAVDHVVISQIYSGGGNTGAAYTNDYVELYNPSATSFNLTGWSLQYASATGSGWGTGTQSLAGTIAPGEYYLVALASGGVVGQPLPAANITGEINMSGTAGKIALVRNGEALIGACPLDDSDIVDFVGYGSTATCSEGNAPAPTASSAQAIFRNSGGNTDTNINGSDFTAQSASPRRTAIIAEIGPSVSNTDPRPSGINAPRDASVTVGFSEPVNVDSSWFVITCVNGAQHNDATVAVSSNFKSYVITPNTNFVPGEQCSVKINKDAVHDRDTDDAAPNTDTLAADYFFSFTVATGAAPPYPKSVHLTMGNPTSAFANTGEPNNFLMEKDAFALSYNRDRGSPNWVSWHLDNSWTGSLVRNDTFRPDPMVPSDWYRVQATDYFGSGFDRGHLTPNADRDNAASIPINQETFLMSNMIPQAPDNNQGPWAAMENDLRSLLTDTSGNEYELYVVAGGAGVGGTGGNGLVTNFAAGRVTVPAFTWKVVLMLPKGEGDMSRVGAATRTIAVIMPNKQGIRNDNWKNYLTNVDEVEKLTGYDFFSNVPDDIENSIEAGTNGANSPVANNQSAIVDEDAPLALTLSAMSANSNPLVYTIVSQPANGTLSLTGAAVTYTPNNDFNGADGFTFQASDGLFKSNTATVSIRVAEINDAPVAVADAKATDEDRTLDFAAAELLQNDSTGAVNENGQTLAVTSVTATGNTHGRVFLNNGQITYSPAENFSGQAVFDYTACDNGTSGGAADFKCGVATVDVTVAPVNDAPVLAAIGSKTINEDTPLTFTATAADVDLPANVLNFVLVGAPDGAVINSSNGYFSWTPSEPGVYRFAVKVTDDGTPALADEEEVVVTVFDTTPPLINNAPSDQILEATGASGATAIWTAPGATDAVDGNVAVECSRHSGSVFSIGATVVDCSAIDKAGNSAVHTFIITVRDTTAPVITGIPANQTLEATSPRGAVASWVSPTAFDTVDGAVSVSCGSASGDTFSIGSHKISCTATDARQNAASITFTVTVVDTTAPSINIVSPTGGNYLLGQSVSANYTCGDVASGVASCVGTIVSGALINTSSVGAKTFSVTALDNSGNIVNQTVAYTVGFGVSVLFDQTKQHNAGSTIPIKLQIVDAAGVNKSAANPAVSVVRIMTGNLSVQSPGNTQPDGFFKFEDGVYQFNLKTKELQSGVYRLVFRVAGDPIEHSVQFIIR